MSRIINKKAIQYAKKQILKHEANGCFSTECYVFLFDKYVEQFRRAVLK